MSNNKPVEERKTQMLEFHWGKMFKFGFVGILKSLPWATGAAIMLGLLGRFGKFGDNRSETLLNASGWVCIVGVWGGFAWGLGLYMRAVAPTLGDKQKAGWPKAAITAKCCIGGSISGALLWLVAYMLLEPARSRVGLPPNPNPPYVFGLLGLTLTPILMLVLPEISKSGFESKKSETDGTNEHSNHRIGG